MVTEAAAVADMSRPPSSCQTTPPFYRVSERDLTEIELHSVDSISDLHRTHDHSHKGARPPRSPAQSSSPNGNVYAQDTTAANHKGQPISSKWQGHLKDMLNSSSSRAYVVTCGVVTLLLLIVLLIFYFLVEQGNALRTLTQAVRDKHTVSMEISQLIQELQALRHNLTAMRGP